MNLQKCSSSALRITSFFAGSRPIPPYFAATGQSCFWFVEDCLPWGSNTVGKEHLPILYSQARARALKLSNIESAWSKTGLFPLNPGKALREVKPYYDANPAESKDTTAVSPTNDTLQNPVTPNSLTILGRKIDKDVSTLDNSSKALISKLFKAAERAITKGVLFGIEFERLRKQNDEKVR